MTSPTYQLSSSDRALWLGMGPLRLAVAGVALLASVLASYGGVNLALAAIPVILAATWCFASVRGLPAHELTRAGVSYGSRVVEKGRTWSLPLQASEPRPRLTRLELPPECGKLSLSELEVDGLAIGVLRERRREGWHVGCVLRVTADSDFTLSAPDEQARRLHLWGDVLTALCGEHADRCRLQWLEQCRPAVPDGALPEDLSHVVRTEGREHSTMLSLWLSSGEKNIDEAHNKVTPLVRLLASRLLSAEVVMAPLTALQLVGALSGSSDPNDDNERTHLVGSASRRESWDHTEIDGALHRGFLVTGWPRLPSNPSWMAPLLQEGPSVGQRVVTVHFLAVRHDVADRRARAARQSALLDVDERSRLGFGVGARERRTQASAESIEDELSAGHAQHRVAGLIVVTAQSRGQLDQACRETLAQASSARLEVRALDGQHALAWAAALPLCRLAHRAAA